MNHPKNLKGYDSLEELAKDISELHYESLTELFRLLYKKIEADAEADLKRGRPKLSEQLSNTSEALYDAYTSMYNAWKISEPYMKDKKK